MASVKDHLEIPSDSVEPGPSARIEVVKKATDINIYRLVVLSFGLLCILQVALNILLRQIVYHSDKTRSAEDPGDRGEIRTAQKDQLRGMFCFYDDENGHDSLNLTALTDTLKEQLAEVCPSVYYISSSVKTWQESRKDCLERDADLLIINSKEEQRFMGQFKGPIWIGLTDAEKEGEWKWVDGTQMNTSFWIPGEPNNYHGKEEDCAETASASENKWNDKNCEHQNYWICERKLLKKTATDVYSLEE